jgi:uncharacterized protein (TIGR00369 family)
VSAFAEFVQSLLLDDSPEQKITVIPYAEFLGLHVRISEDMLIVRMPFVPDLIGNPMPARLHGGAIGGLLEITGALTVARTMMRTAQTPEKIVVPKPVTVTLDYLRAGAAEDTCASAQITRLGRRVVNLRADAWQTDRTRLISAAHMNVMVG